MTMRLDPSHDWLCRQIVDNSHLAIVFADRDGRVRLWNSGAEKMFGWAVTEALGNSLDMIIPEKHRAQHWAGWDRVMQSGETKYGTNVLAVPALTKEGTRISVEFNISLLRAPDGEILGAAATIQNVTARWEREKQLRARLSAAEAKALAGT